MSRFDQRLKQRLKNRDFAAGFAEMDAQIALMRAIEECRRRRNISKADLAKRMGRPRPSVSRLLSGVGGNPTLDTITDLFSALGVRAHLQILRARPKQPVLTVKQMV